MARYLVVRAWIVEADSTTEAIEKAKPGEHRDVRARLCWPGEVAARLTFATGESHDLGDM
jgi:hypothetical protein